MAWVRLDDNVPHHRKHLMAGPAACWLWVACIAYAQRHLTDGIVPREAVPTLGVPNPRKLLDKLIEVGLLDRHDLGFRVHDYLDHNACRDEALASQAEKSAVRAESGRRGGLASGRKRRAEKVDFIGVVEANAKQSASLLPKQNASTSEFASEAPSHPIPSHPVATKNVATKDERLDVAFLDFQSAYPANRRKGGFMVQQGFIDAVQKAGGVDGVMAALANHKASDQWQKPSLIPSMDKWLAEERWRQRLDPPGAAPATGSLRTAGNAAALQRFIDRGIA
jgi:hypothetical protein